MAVMNQSNKVFEHLRYVLLVRLKEAVVADAYLHVLKKDSRMRDIGDA
jgi:hypothetical protein